MKSVGKRAQLRARLEKYEPLMGKFSDVEVARLVVCSPATVGRFRRDNGTGAATTETRKAAEKKLNGSWAWSHNPDWK